jgi:hypothetical protein
MQWAGGAHSVVAMKSCGRASIAPSTRQLVRTVHASPIKEWAL